MWLGLADLNGEPRGHNLQRAVHSARKQPHGDDHGDLS
jgi:hypothetical protein